MTAPLPSCILYTRDRELPRTVAAYLDPHTRLIHCRDTGRLDVQLRHASNTLVLLDLRAEGARDRLRTLLADRDDLMVLALGPPKSEPLKEAEQLGAFGTLDLPIQRMQFKSMTLRSASELAMRMEIESLKEQVAQAPAEPAAPPPHAASLLAPPIGTFSRSLRHINNLGALMEGVVDSVAAATRVTRPGLFARSRDDDSFRFAAGLRCLEEPEEMVYEPGDPLVRWLEIHACQVARSHLNHINQMSDRLMLKRELDLLGAEVILPLLGRNRLLGFLFVGNRATGLPFAYEDYEHLLEVAEHIATTLENAYLYEEVAIQKTLAESLLHSVPTGIVSIGTDGHIKSMNQAAQDFLERPIEEVATKPVSALGSHLGDVLLRALRLEESIPPQEWMDPRTKNTLITEARRLMLGKECLGAVAILHNITNQRKLEEKREQLERASFWTDLAASMSHEVRNPLVAIKTFSQLLPDRYEDEEFRQEFSSLVTVEVDRLNKIIEQINDFANPPQLRFAVLDLAKIIRSSIQSALTSEEHSGIRISTSFAPELQPVEGDAAALTECISNLIVNAMEATFDQGQPTIEVSADMQRTPAGEDRVVVIIKDNGPGIPEEFQDKVFSPFCTSKPRGMGLGLPIAKRTIIDHNGTMAIETDASGTGVVVTFPAAKSKVLT